MNTPKVVVCILYRFGKVTKKELSLLDKAFPGREISLRWLMPLNRQHYLELCRRDKPVVILVQPDLTHGVCALAIEKGFKHFYALNGSDILHLFHPSAST